MARRKREKVEERTGWPGFCEVPAGPAKKRKQGVSRCLENVLFSDCGRDRAFLADFRIRYSSVEVSLLLLLAEATSVVVMVFSV